jgi:HD superfamily phosphodiesterase
MISDVMEKMVTYFEGDVKRINHALKVYSFAKTISGREDMPLDGRKITELAAVLHDIGIKESQRKYGSSEAKYQELEGPPVATGILEAVNAAPELIKRVSYLIGNHHTYGKIDGLDFQILVEADFIVNAFEDEMEPAAIRKISDKYFKTATGRKIIESLYLTGKA